jgi:hypothetical protein
MGSSQSQSKKPLPVLEKPPSLEEKIGHLEKRKKYLETNAQNYMTKAKECATQADKLGAKRYLMSAKRCQDELQKIYGMLVRLEELKHAQENTKMNRDVLLSIEHGTRVLGQNTINVDNAENIVDNMEEAIQNAQEVSYVFARGIPSDASVEKELEEMMREPRQQPQVPQELPQIPTKMPVQPVGMDAELQELERVAVPA